MGGPEPKRSVAVCHGVLSDFRFHPGARERFFAAPFWRLELYSPGGARILRAWAVPDAEDRAALRASPDADLYWRAIVGPDGTYVRHD